MGKPAVDELQRLRGDLGDGLRPEGSEYGKSRCYCIEFTLKRKGQCCPLFALRPFLAAGLCRLS
jgi:hypothetical protein